MTELWPGGSAASSGAFRPGSLSRYNAPVMGKGPRIDIAALTDRGKVREANEDAYGVFKIGRFAERVSSSVPEEDLASMYDGSAWFLAVADGMGGHAAGEIASRDALIEIFRIALRAPRWLLNLDDPACRELEIQAFYDRTKLYVAGMHAAILQEGSEDPSKRGMGTTFSL